MTIENVRIAVPEDEDQLMALCRLNHAENGDHPLNEDKVRAMLRRGLFRNGGIIGVVGAPGDLKAMIILIIDEIWYSSDFQMLELVNYVHPDHRRSTYAKDMIEFAKLSSDGTGIDLTIGVLSSVRMEAKCRLYARQLPKAGEFFIHHPSAMTNAERQSWSF